MHSPEPARPPEMLEHRPEARAFKVEDILLEIQRGRLRIPSFQRRLAWDRGDARKLVDSLYRGYPVGTLLLWETSAHEAQMQWGSLRLQADNRPDALLVVDGQQRLVSLARVLLTTDDDADEFALYFDLDLREFVFPATAERHGDDPARWLPLNRLLNSEHLFEWLYERQPSRERRERALQLGKRLREYDIPAYIVRQGSESILREIFGRLNWATKRLEVAEVFDALNSVRTGHPAPRTAMGQERMAWPVMRFLQREAGIPHASLLPSKQPLVTLGKFFFHHPKPRSRSRELLARWLWRGALNGSHLGNTVSTRAALDRIDPEDEERAVQGMLDMVGRTKPVLPAATDPFNFRFAASKLQALALLELQPRHLETGELLDLAAPLDYQQANQVPPFPPLLQDRAVKGGLGLSVANRLAHPVQQGLRKTLLQVQDAAILASHGITAEAFSALHSGDSQQFLHLRATTLQQHFEHVFARHARWDASDRPSLASLVVSDDDEDEDERVQKAETTA